jgi:hypothetical protein
MHDMPASKHSGNYMHQMIEHLKTLHCTHVVNLCALHNSCTVHQPQDTIETHALA